MDQPGQHPFEPTPTSRRQGRLAAIFLMVAGSLVIGVSLLRSVQTRRIPSELPQVGRPLSQFTLSDLQGRAVSLNDYAGQPVLINFWATWCPPCRAEMPDLQALHAEQQNSGLVVLAINSGETKALAASFASEFGLNFPVLLDEDFILSDQWMINNLPTTILVGRDGKVKVIHVGVYRLSQMNQEILPHLKP